jgi:Lysophospholipase
MSGVQLLGAHAHAPFGPDPVPEGVEVVALGSSVGELTALLAPARGSERGRVLAIPGFTGSKEDFTHFLPRLSAAGYTTLAYSQRGQADSAAPRGRRHYRLGDFSADALHVARALGAGDAPVHLLGHSFGGVVARATAISSPDLFRTLTLFSSGPRAVREFVPPALLAVLPHGPITHRLLRRTLHPDMPTTPQSDPRLEMLRQRVEATSDDSLVAIARILTTYPDATDHLRATHLPVHVVHGAEDPVWPLEWYGPEVERLGALHTVIPHAQHSAQLENPAALAAALVDFWEAHP